MLGPITNVKLECNACFVCFLFHVVLPGVCWNLAFLLIQSWTGGRNPLNHDEEWYSFLNTINFGCIFLETWHIHFKEMQIGKKVALTIILFQETKIHGILIPI